MAEAVTLDGVAKLETLVAYQDGAVVSRTLVKKPTGTITLFAFDRGQGLSEHTTPFDALVVLLDGEASITIDGNVNALKSGDALILPAGKPHAVAATARFKMMLTMIRS